MKPLEVSLKKYALRSKLNAVDLIQDMVDDLSARSGWTSSVHLDTCNLTLDPYCYARGWTELDDHQPTGPLLPRDLRLNLMHRLP